MPHNDIVVRTVHLRIIVAGKGEGFCASPGCPYLILTSAVPNTARCELFRTALGWEKGFIRADACLLAEEMK